MKIHSLFVPGMVTFLALAAGAPLLRAQEAVPVQLFRLSNAGERFETRVVFTGSTNWRSQVAGKEKDKEDHSVEMGLEATAKILEVDEQGRFTRVEYVVKSATQKESGKSESHPLAVGAVVLWANAPGQKFEVDGKPPSPEAQIFLNQLLPPTCSHVALADGKLLGLNEKRKPLDTWKPDVPAYRKFLQAQAGLESDEKGCSGNVTFKELKRVDGAEACEVDAEMRIKATAMRNKPDVIFKEGITVITARFVLPVDSKLPAALAEASSETDLTVERTRIGQPASIERVVRKEKWSTTRKRIP